MDLKEEELTVLKNKKIGKRLIAAFLAVSIITATVGCVGIYGMAKLKATADDMCRTFIATPEVAFLSYPTK